MQYKVFSIRDSKAEIFNLPWYKTTLAEALRDFSTVAKDPKTLPGQYPEDFDLWYMGDYDDQTGKITSLPTPQHMEKAVNLLKKPSQTLEI